MSSGSTGCGSLTGHTLVESTLFPRYLNEIALNQRGIDVELTSVPSGPAECAFAP